MPYVLRGQGGEIQAISQSQSGFSGWEFIDSGAKEYLEYLDAAIKKESPFRESDIQLARVLEDLIELLIERDLIRFTDFPAAAQKRLNYRQTLRKSPKMLNLIEDNDGLI